MYVDMTGGFNTPIPGMPMFDTPVREKEDPVTIFLITKHYNDECNCHPNWQSKPHIAYRDQDRAYDELKKLPNTSKEYYDIDEILLL